MIHLASLTVSTIENIIFHRIFLFLVGSWGINVDDTYIENMIHSASPIRWAILNFIPLDTFGNVNLLFG